MTWSLSQRRWSRAMNSKFIYGYVPLLHSIIFFIEMAIVARLVARFNKRYEERPVLTMMVTNAVLGGIADTVAQTIAVVRQRQKAIRKDADAKGSADYIIEFQDMSRTSPIGDRDLAADVPRPRAPPFDFERLTRFMAYGFMMAPIQFKWFRFLERCFPITGTSALGPAMKRVVFDQLIFSPVGIAWFFTAMTLSEGGGRQAVQTKLRDMFIPTLKANFMIWPAVQVINFRLMPVQFQLPFVSTVGIAWTAYLSLSNAADDVQMNKAHITDSPRIRLS